MNAQVSTGPPSAGVRRPPEPSGNGQVAPPKLRRRPALVAVSVVLVAVGALLAAWVTTSIGDARPVLAARVDVPRGQVITADDVTVVRIGLDPALATIPAAEADLVVGMRAGSDLSAGGLITPGSVTDQGLPGEGESIVGLGLSAGQMPAQELRPGDRVRVVSTPRQGEDPPVATPPAVPARVVGTRVVAETGALVVDVVVPQDQAAGLAAVAATGRAALVLDGAVG